MTYKEFLERLTASSGYAPDDAEHLLKASVETIVEHVKDMDDVAIPSFGTFQPVKAKECIITDSGTGTRMLLPPNIDLRFKPSVVLRKSFVG